jgi:hypothetical protein
VTGLLWAALGVIGGFGLAAIGDMVSEEVRDRFDHMPHAILRLAVRRLDPTERVPIYDEEWLPELTYILQGDEARPVTRLYHGTRFAVGILLTVRRITRNLHRTAPIVRAAPGALRLDGLQSGGGLFSVRRTVRHLVLGAQLRQLREVAGITRQEVAAVISDSSFEVSAIEHKIGLMEYGREEFKEGDIADLLTLYGVGPGDRREWLLRMAREVNVPGWWHAYSDILSPWVEPYLSLEVEASFIREYEPQFVPGLLQIAGYARAVIRMGNKASEEEVIRRAESTIWRQDILRRKDPAKVWAVLDEGALCRLIGGREVMRAQLRHLVDMCDHPSVALQILPFDAGARLAIHGGVTILRYTEPELPDIAYVEQLSGALYIDNPAEIDRYLEAMEDACLRAAPYTETKAVLKRYLADI